jgi:hypothetical protein
MSAALRLLGCRGLLAATGGADLAMIGAPSGPFSTSTSTNRVQCESTPTSPRSHIRVIPEAQYSGIPRQPAVELPGYIEADAIQRVDIQRSLDPLFRTYFGNSRSDEAMGSIWSYLDITLVGGQDSWEDSPEGYSRQRQTSGGLAR